MRTAPARKVPSEDSEQIRLVNWLEKHYPEIRFYHTANGKKRDKVTGHALKMLGVKAGVPDLVFPEPRNGKCGLYIEMKKIKGGKVSPEQKDWLNWLASVGYATAVCAGAENAKEIIADYFYLKPRTEG
jgi:hypothetical protein